MHESFNKKFITCRLNAEWRVTENESDLIEKNILYVNNIILLPYIIIISLNT